ncbi:glycosyltransferase [Pseudomonadota bacterium]
MTVSPLWIAPSYPCEADGYGGIWLRTQAHALSAIGIRPRIVAPVPWVPPGLGAIAPQWARYTDVPSSYDDDGTEVLRPRYFSHPRENKLGAPHLMQLLGLRLAGLAKPSLVHAHFALPYGWVAMRLARHWDVPLVVSLLGDDVNVYPHFSAGHLRRFREVIEAADVVLSQGSALDDATEALTGRRPRTLPLGVNLDMFTKTRTRAEARAHLNLPTDRPIAFFVGSLFESKGVAELLRALARLSDHNVLGVFAGDGPLRHMVDGAPNAMAIGSLSQKGVRDYMEAADMVVLPSHREGLPLCLVEAGAMECPVVASDVGSVRDLIGRNGDERGRLITAKDEDALTAAMAAVLGDSDEAARRAARLLGHVCEHFSDTANARALADIYQSLL